MDTQHSLTSQVQVVLSDCSGDDAERVLGALHGFFAAGSGDGDGSRTDRSEKSTAWTGVFDTQSSGSSAPDSPVRLSGPVTVELQGTCPAVKAAREALEKVFGVQETGHVSGDQEVEVGLRLESLDGAA
ncbi:hypothetical protein [Streptomyces minutiscleroticus]|uniref:hypothetical protein n=1 Tax=Streptomyces minutiscleroticus TaxID=68238 RepID=UPI00332D7C8C